VSERKERIDEKEKRKFELAAQLATSGGKKIQLRRHGGQKRQHQTISKYIRYIYRIIALVYKK